MFDPSPHPRVFAIPPGVDLPQALVRGLITRQKGQPPEAIARVELIVNTARMMRRVQLLFDDQTAGFLPRLSLITGVGTRPEVAHIPPALPRLRRRLELVQLISRLLEAQPDLAPRAALFDLATSLAELIDEMQGEGVPPAAIQALDVSDLSGHWARAQQFLSIAEDFVAGADAGLDSEARQRQVVETLAAYWQENPPSHPVILAGSTGSRGTTQLLMQAIARLPQGAVILPGFDVDQSAPVWDRLQDPLEGEDHPQFRFSRLMSALDLSPGDIDLWDDTPPVSSARNRLVSLALRPAPVTDSWMREGPQLEDLTGATQYLTLVEAPDPRQEALAIALRLRQAAENGQSAALITPDRMLTRQVTAALDRWDILPDDSAGTPPHLSPPGRFLRHVAGLFTAPLTSEALLTLLKHPLCHSGADRNEHSLLTRDLELALRKSGPPHPDTAWLTAWGAAQDNPRAQEWAAWVAAHFDGKFDPNTRELADWTLSVRTLSETIAAGSAVTGSGGLWDKKAGARVLGELDALAAEAGSGGALSARDFGDLLYRLLSAAEGIRDRDAPHSNIMIWGTLEARVQGADLLILGGLNENSWPQSPTPDPWLNRSMRDKAGLLLPERRIGLAAHDFQQAIAAPEVWLTRSVRSDDAETVPSRWLARLTNLMGGLGQTGGQEALAAMKARGTVWLDRVGLLEAAPPLPLAPRPSPRPPVAARPNRLSVTEIKTLIRDPYAVYAKHVLRLRPLDPLHKTPDALLRGILLHSLLEEFVKEVQTNTDALSRDHLMQRAETLIQKEVPWPTARRLWLARVDRFADWFVGREQRRQAIGQPVAFERKARAVMDDIGFTLTGTADRLDRDLTGALHIYDYKSGRAPTPAEQAAFDKQLLIEAAMAEQGAFDDLDPAKVEQAVYIGLHAADEKPAPLDKEPPAKVWDELRQLVAAYLSPDQGFTARRRMQKDSDTGDYDQLARFGEWDHSAEATPEDLI